MAGATMVALARPTRAMPTRRSERAGSSKVISIRPTAKRL
jgi:hypothetical protein